MKRSLLFVLAGLMSFALPAQRLHLNPKAQAIINHLNALNHYVDATPCKKDSFMVITNRAINKLFGDKVASYLSEGGDLSLFKNYATLSPTDGKLSVNMNVLPPPKSDNRVTHLLTLGFNANIKDGFSTLFAAKKNSTDINFRIKYTYLGRGSISVDDCIQTTKHALLVKMKPQKSHMALERQLILENLSSEIRQRSADFENALHTAQAPTELKQDKQDKFYQGLSGEYEKKFADQQVDAIEENKAYKTAKTWWISSILDIPISRSEYLTAPGYTLPFATTKFFPWSFSFSYNRIWESQRLGKLFVLASAGIQTNNPIKTEQLTKTSLDVYRRLSGTDTLQLASLSADEAYVGDYKTFLSPSVHVQAVYFLPGWNLGTSVQLERFFGNYDPLNLKLGLPIRLNDKDGKPTVNFEIQYKVADISSRLTSGKSWGEKSTIGLSVGLPFNSILY